MTRRLYYDDAYTTEFTAQVTESLTVNGCPAVSLDQTYFYPTGGGQPHDTGTINGVEVIEVVSGENGTVLHLLKADISGIHVQCNINWGRRFDHMQHHTGQHLLTQAFLQIGDANTVGFHLSADSVTIDLDQTALSSETLTETEALANQIIQENRPVYARLLDANNIDQIRMRKMPEKIYTDGLRVIDIEGFDVTACGGTHVAATGEIGLIKIVKVEKRGDKLRVEFRCGQRALRDYAEKHTVVTGLTAELTCSANEVQQAVARLRDDLKTAQQSLKAIRNRLLDYEAATLIASSSLHAGKRVICVTFDNRDTEEVRILASKLVETPATTALLGASGDKSQIIFARSKDLSYDMNALIKSALSSIGARGGGRPELAQGGGIPATFAQIEMALQTAKQSLV